MVIDTSALLAILFREPEEARLLTAITLAARSWVCTANWTEVMIVAEGRKGEDAANRLQLIIAHLEIGMTAIEYEYGVDGSGCVEKIRQRTPWRSLEQGRLLGLCGGSSTRRAAAVQGAGLHENRHIGRGVVAGYRMMRKKSKVHVRRADRIAESEVALE